jgi:hypothetical protein
MLKQEQRHPEGGIVTIKVKMYCITRQESVQMEYVRFGFIPMYDTSIPEDQRYSTATPSGEVSLLVNKPNLFEIGKYYYLTFEEVDKDGGGVNATA